MSTKSLQGNPVERSYGEIIELSLPNSELLSKIPKGTEGIAGLKSVYAAVDEPAAQKAQGNLCFNSPTKEAPGMV